ncbi:hypothetical protein Tco_0933070, partial [Tanacetum coccineum]
MDNQLLNQSESELNLLNCFVNFDSIPLTSSINDERDPSNGEGNAMASSDIDSPHPVIDEATFATQLDENNNSSEGNQVEVTGSTSDIDNKKYGIEKCVNYSKLSPMNFYFESNLNKSIEPKTYLKAAQDKHWVEAMINKIKA